MDPKQRSCDGEKVLLEFKNSRDILDPSIKGVWSNCDTSHSKKSTTCEYVDVGRHTSTLVDVRAVRHRNGSSKKISCTTDGRPFTPRTWLRSPRNFGNARFRRFAKFDFLKPKKKSEKKFDFFFRFFIIFGRFSRS